MVSSATEQKPNLLACTGFCNSSSNNNNNNKIVKFVWRFYQALFYKKLWTFDALGTGHLVVKKVVNKGIGDCVLRSWAYK